MAACIRVDHLFVLLGATVACGEQLFNVRSAESTGENNASSHACSLSKTEEKLKSG